MPAPRTTPSSGRLVRASTADTARIAIRIVLPSLAAGVIVRRPRAMALAERFQLDRSAIRLMVSLRRRYGNGPLRLPIPGRKLAMVLDPTHVREILREHPRRFTPANREKRAALNDGEQRAPVRPEGVDGRRREREPGRRAVQRQARPLPGTQSWCCS